MIVSIEVRYAAQQGKDWLEGFIDELKAIEVTAAAAGVAPVWQTLTVNPVMQRVHVGGPGSLPMVYDDDPVAIGVRCASITTEGSRS